MDQHRMSLPAKHLPLNTPGTVTTFYAYEGGPARNALLAAMALQLAADPAQAPVLVIDWDLESPSLHGWFGEPQDDEEACGLVDYVDALREALLRQRGRPGHEHLDAAADAVLDAVDWRAYLSRADGRHPLYLMSAGRFDAGYAERAGRLDWDALFDACPALLRRFAARMARHFRHVLVACRSGRSAAVSACTTLVPDRLVGLFTPAPGSLDGLAGVVERAVDYRCTHEDEQRPLLVYPVACSADGMRGDPGQRWRRGDAAGEGYQARVEALLGRAYGLSQLRLEHWFDEVHLPLCVTVAIAPWDAGRRGLAHPAACLLSWFTRGGFPWHSPEEVRLREAIARLRLQGDSAAQLAAHLARLGSLCREEERAVEAEALLRDSLALHGAALGPDHPDTRATLAALAALHLGGDAEDDDGQHGEQMHKARLDEARRAFEALVQSCARSVGAEHAETLAARSSLACTLGRLGERERALALHEQVVATCERLWGEAHPATLDSLEDLAVTLGRQQEKERARVLLERVLEGRRSLQGREHQDSLRCARRLALLLAEMGELGNARRLLEAVLRACERQEGPYALPTQRVRAALAEVFAAQGDMAALRGIGMGQAAALAPPHAEPDVSVLDDLQGRCAQLQELIDRDSQREARVLADNIRDTLPWSSVAHSLRKRAAAMIEQVYLQDGDMDAVLALNKDLVSSLEGALSRSRRHPPPALPGR